MHNKRIRRLCNPKPTFVALLELQSPAEAADFVGQIRLALDARTFTAADGVLSC